MDIRYSFTNIIPRQETVGSIRQPSNYSGGDEDGTEFIRCVDVRQPKINEVWTFGEDSVTPKVHLTARLDVDAFVGECFATD